jgi:hypothetical protein
MNFKTYLSDRNIPLVFNGEASTFPGIITIENYLKWYNLYIVRPDGSVEKLQSDNTIAWRDHVPCPSDIVAFADRRHLDIDQQSMEMIVGRYTLEARDIDPEAIGIEYGLAPKKTPASTFCDEFHTTCAGSLADIDLGAAHHVFVTPELIDAANDLSDSYYAALEQNLASV